MSSSLTVRLQPTPAAVGLARQQLDLIRDRLTDEAFHDARLLVSELITNSLRHATLATGQEIELAMRLDGSTLWVEVRDPGPGFEPRPRSATSSTESGWGLFLVARLADRWGVERDGQNRVWFELSGAAPSPDAL
jgi:anti-sigma regulatory factor (Ser/Thr protein kinase)